MKVLTVLQPGYMPYLGFFDLSLRSDIFIIYDDVQYDKNSWRNRNRIKTQKGPIWLTVPILTRNKGKPSIRDAEIDNRTNWRKKHLDSIRFNYIKSPFFQEIFLCVEKILTKPWHSLLELDMAFIRLFSSKLKLNSNYIFSSSLKSHGHKTKRLVNLCKELGAVKYLSTNGAKPYLNEKLFGNESITLEYQNFNHPKYPQLFGEFVPSLSVLDLLFNCGPESLSILKNHKVGTCL